MTICTGVLSDRELLPGFMPGIYRDAAVQSELDEQDAYAHRYWGFKQVFPLRGTEANWDGYFGAALQDDSLTFASALLGYLKSEGLTVKPHVSPTRKGGVLLNFAKGSKEFEIQVNGVWEFEFLFADDNDPAKDIEEKVKNKYDFIRSFRNFLKAQENFQSES